MDYFPFFFNLRTKTVLIVGGGEIAYRKTQLLVRAHARLRVVAPNIDPKLAALINQCGGEGRYKSFHLDDLKDCVAVVSATDKQDINEQVAQAAQQMRIPVNVVDCPRLSDFIFPAIVDRSPTVVAISSGGASPVLARRLRTQIESLLPTTWAQLTSFCQKFRERVKNTLPMNKRRSFWESFIDSAAAQAILTGDQKTATRLFHQQLNQKIADQKPTGFVYLIGAGPGDADLLTLKALRLLQRAEVVVYDRLVSESVLEMARRDAKKIYVGKSRDHHIATQEQINHLLIESAKKGNCVARLKGGDPFIFGRGGEEQQALMAADIPVEVVPGITAATACATSSGIPLTQRNIARGVRFCTAYQKDMYDSAYWQKLASDTETTLVFYMAGATLLALTTNLINAGRSSETPIAIVCAGGTPAQKIIHGQLNDIVERAKGQLFSPALIIIGAVVNMLPLQKDKVNTFEKIMVTPFSSPSPPPHYALT